MSYAAEVYENNRASTASPVTRLLTVYDYALSACKGQRLWELSKALRVLHEGLDFDFPMSFNLAAIYEWCADLARQGQWDEAAQILGELRDSWAAAARGIQSTDVTDVLADVQNVAVYSMA
ncbi:MAG TPA: flagellar protein FliS [Chloroflexi bacterium]|jgi:flagellin-specific chaperone FliS|nr:flagellar protein FliS [Chloroflexota bacterium]